MLQRRHKTQLPLSLGRVFFSPRVTSSDFKGKPVWLDYGFEIARSPRWWRDGGSRSSPVIPRAFSYKMNATFGQVGKFEVGGSQASRTKAYHTIPYNRISKARTNSSASLVFCLHVVGATHNWHPFLINGRFLCKPWQGSILFAYALWR